MINNLECFIVELLQGNLTYDNKNVEVRREFKPSGVLPCITLDIYSTPGHEYLRNSYKDGYKLILCHNAELNLNLWCNNETERRNISEQIMNLYYEELALHDSSDSLTYKYDIVPHTLLISLSYFADELDEKPVLLRSIFTASCQFLTTYNGEDEGVIEDIVVDADDDNIVEHAGEADKDDEEV